MPTAQNPSDPNVAPSRVLPKGKPFLAVSNPLKQPAQPSYVLQQHARTDSPLPLSIYAKQKTHSVEDFHLRASLSAAEVQERVGPPVQRADYSSPWFVYRLSQGRELWLHFSQPDNLRLLQADVVTNVEDGVSRDRIFSVDGSH